MKAFIGLAVVAMLVTPAWANLLTNGDFEASGGSTTGWGGDVELNSTIHGPGAGPAGPNYGSAQAGGQNVNRVLSQTVNGLTPGGTYKLDGFIAGGVAGTNGDLIVKLIGATVDSQTFHISAPGGGIPWTAHNQLSAQATAGGSITVEYRATSDGGWSNGTAVHADGANLTPEPASLAMFVLAGLPMLRRRR